MFPLRGVPARSSFLKKFLHKNRNKNVASWYVARNTITYFKKNRNKFTTEILKTQWHFNSPCFRLWSFTSLTLGSGRLRLFTFFYYLRFNIIVCYLIWYKGTTTAPKCLKMAKILVV